MTKVAAKPALDLGALIVRPPRGLVVTDRWLRRHGACLRHVRNFRELWPDGVVLSRGVLLAAARAGLPVGTWVGYRLLTSAALRRYRDEANAIRQSSLPRYAELGAKYANGLLTSRQHQARYRRLLEKNRVLGAAALADILGLE